MEQLAQNLNYVSVPTEPLRISCFLPILPSLDAGETPVPLNCWAEPPMYFGRAQLLLSGKASFRSDSSEERPESLGFS